MCISLSRGLQLRSNMLRNLQNLIKWGLQDTERFPRHCSHWISVSKEGYGINTWGRRGSSSLGYRQSVCHSPVPWRNWALPKLGGEFPQSRSPFMGWLDRRGRQKQHMIVINYFTHKIQRSFHQIPLFWGIFYRMGSVEKPSLDFIELFALIRINPLFLSRKENDAKAAFRV